MEIGGRSGRSLLAPQRVDENVGGDDTIGVQQQRGEQRPLFAAAEGKPSTALDDLESTEKPELHTVSVAPSPEEGNTAARAGFQPVQAGCKCAASNVRENAAVIETRRHTMTIRVSRRGRVLAISLAAAALVAGIVVSTAGATPPPANSGRPTIGGVPRDGETLQASPGSWTGSVPMAFAFQWQRCSTTAGSQNVAFGRRAAATSELPGSPPGNAVDGNVDTIWNAGQFAPQSIEIDLGSPHALRSVRLTTSQNPAGFTQHVVWGRGPGVTDAWRVLAEFEGVTTDAVQLAAPAAPGPDVQFLAVDTYSSPSWVGWREIEAFGECLDIGGATGSAYTATAADIGSSLRVAVTASNAEGNVTAVSEQTAAVAAVAPQSLAPPVVEGVARQGELLTASPGSWRGTQPLELVFRWQRCNQTGEACVDVDANEIDTYLLGPADVGRTIRVRVTARNVGGTAEAFSGATPVVTGLPRTRRCIVPNVRRKRLAAARAAIRRAGCTVGRVRRVRSNRLRGRVVSQRPRAGARRPRGTRVNLVVSRGRR